MLSMLPRLARISALQRPIAPKLRSDIDLAQAVCRFIEALRPAVFTLENVWAYRQSRSWALIEDTLFRLGYLPDVQHLNAADFGVPQTRKRMIVRAVRGGFAPALPAPVPWVGWYAAIEDLIPTLSESHFAPWQLERLPEELASFLVAGSKAPNGVQIVKRNPDEPASTVVASGDRLITRAFLMTGQGSGEESRGGLRDSVEPALTVTASSRKGLVSAFLVHPTDQRTMPVVDREEPSFTVVGNHGNGNMPRVYLVDGKLSNSGKDLQIRQREDPSTTVVSSQSAMKDARAWLSKGRVVKMTPRALARFQSFPDSYQLPEKAWLACKGIGNAVPPLPMQRIYEQFNVT